MREKSDYFTKSRYVYDMVKDDILSGRYAPGEKIVIRNVSEELNISDIPVREAMRKLEAEELVVFSPHVGATVASISFEEMKEIISLRELLEPYAAKLAVEKISSEKIDQLKQLVDEMDQCIEEDDYHSYGKLNKEFHLCIYEDCGNHTLFHIVKDLMEKTERTRAIFRMLPSRMRDSNSEHKQLLKAIEEKDEAAVEEIVKHQRLRSTERYLDQLDAKIREEQTTGKSPKKTGRQSRQ